MISANDRREFLETIKDEEYRHEFAAENPGVALAFQINLIREARGWTQEELAKRCDKAQETISRLEDPDYGRYTLKTLKQLAKAFDVALLVRFVSFGELAEWTVNLDSKRLTPPSYGEERQMSFNNIASFSEWWARSAAQEVGRVDANTLAMQSAVAVANNYLTAPRHATWLPVNDAIERAEQNKGAVNAAA